MSEVLAGTVVAGHRARRCDGLSCSSTHRSHEVPAAADVHSLAQLLQGNNDRGFSIFLFFSSFFLFFFFC